MFPSTPPAEWGTVPPWGFRSPIVDRMVVREFRNVVASRWREARDVTREYDQVSSTLLMLLMLQTCRLKAQRRCHRKAGRWREARCIICEYDQVCCQAV